MRKKKEFRLDKVAVRLVKEPPLYSDTPVNTPEAAVKLLGDMLKDYDRHAAGRPQADCCERCQYGYAQ